MIWNTPEDRANKERWKVIFAWIPHRTLNGSYVWLDYVLRRRRFRSLFNTYGQFVPEVPRAKETSHHPVEMEKASASLVGTAILGRR